MVVVMVAATTPVEIGEQKTSDKITIKFQIANIIKEQNRTIQWHIQLSACILMKQKHSRGIASSIIFYF